MKNSKALAEISAGQDKKIVSANSTLTETFSR